MIKSTTFAALEPGPKFLIIGAIHGNEKCGTEACLRVMQELDSGELTLLKGQATFVPIANPHAYDLDQRYVERNLNRFLVPMAQPDCYEAKLGNILCPLLEQCDVHLSIHSYTVGGDPFVFVGTDVKAEQDMAAVLGPRTLLTGWEEAYAATGRKAKIEGDEESTGSIEYARRFGAVAINIECGQHKDPNAPQVAYQAIRNSLEYLKMTADVSLTRKASPTRLVSVERVYYRDDEGHFPKPWKHLEVVKKNQALAITAKGEEVRAPGDGFVIMPKANCPLGEEWFYFGVGAQP